MLVTKSKPGGGWDWLTGFKVNKPVPENSRRAMAGQLAADPNYPISVHDLGLNILLGFEHDLLLRGLKRLVNVVTGLLS